MIIDEVAGQWSVLLVAPLTLEGFIAAFILFRLFDITKPGPIRKARRSRGVLVSWLMILCWIFCRHRAHHHDVDGHLIGAYAMRPIVPHWFTPSGTELTDTHS